MTYPFATARFIIFSKPSYFLVAAFLSVFKAKGTNCFFRRILTLINASRLRGIDKLWRFGQGSTRGTSKAKILSKSHHWNVFVQVAALKQLLFAGPCIPPQMLVQNDHPMQTFQLFNIETNVQEYNLYLVVNEQWDSEHLHLHLYLHLASWQYACAQHNVHLTLVFSLTLGKLALMLALALGSAHRRYAHRHLALASALILTLGKCECVRAPGTYTCTWPCARTG